MGQLQAVAYEANNESNITCEIFTYPAQLANSPTAVLLIQGI